MAGTWMRGIGTIAVAALLGIGSISSARACPFCSMQGQTLTDDVNQASMVLFGTLANARLKANAALGEGETDLKIEEIIKKNEILGDKKTITLPRYVPTDNAQTKFLIFCDVFKGKIDPYRGVPVKADSDMVKYLQGALAVKGKDISTRLKFFFDYLDNQDLEISNDAYKEFGNASYNDYKEMAKHLKREKLAKWLQDPNTPSFRYGLYASMLGHCGNDKDAALLRKMLDDPEKRLNSGVDGVLAGYTLLKPKEGWAYIRGIMNDAKHDFVLRYAALRAARFFWDSRPDVVDKKQIIDGLSLLLDQGDIADLAMEDLRKWEQWQVCDRILGLAGKKSHDIPVVRRAILRFALSCPDKKAAAYVAKARAADANMVNDVEELLKLDAAPPKPAGTSTSAAGTSGSKK